MDYASFLIDDTFKADKVIYMFKNKVNGKVYIGQTIGQARERIKQHISISSNKQSHNHSHLHRAINKYGLQNFEVTIIERCLTQEELDSREVYWIAYFDSTNPNKGYNKESGGKRGKKVPPLTPQHKAKLLKSHMGIPHSEQTKNKMSYSQKSLWKNKEYYDKNIKHFKEIMGWNSNKVYQYDIKGSFIQEWPSECNVSRILYGYSKSCLGRNIKLNLAKGKLGFMKNGSIWTYISPDRKEDLSKSVNSK